MFNPKTHVFSYGGTMPKVDREPHVLNEFCLYMRHRYGASYKVIPDALGCGLVINEDGATVDGVLRTPQGPVAVELLGYSPLEDRGDVMARDEAFRKAVKRSLYDRLNSRSFSLSLVYQVQTRTKPKPDGMVCMVPKRIIFPAVIEELNLIVDSAPALDFNKFLYLRLVKANRRDANLYLDPSRFPVCADHFKSVRLQGLRSGLTPLVESDLSYGWVGLNEAWVEEFLARKAELSLTKSRIRANGLPLWLIVHSDGHAIHQTIPRPHRARAMEICRAKLSDTGHGFVRVYWADGTGFLDAAWVGRAL